MLSWVSYSTVKRWHKAARLHGCITRYQPLLTQILWLDFCSEIQDWAWQDWSLLIFTDESMFNLFNSDVVMYVSKMSTELLTGSPNCEDWQG